jgi:hypothetical protein
MPALDAASLTTVTLNELLLSMLQGTVGALVGLIGLFFVFRLTIRNDRATTKQREQAAAADRARSRVGSAIADIATATAGLPRDAAQAPELRFDSITDLTAAIWRFALDVGQDHPTVEAWVLSQQQLILRLHGEYQNNQGNPIERNRRLMVWTEAAGLLPGRLVLWHTGRLEESWFESAVNAADLASSQ